MNTIKLALIAVLGFGLAACGGGGGSSSGGSNPFAGTYSGNHTVTFTGGGLTTQEQIFLSLTVNGDGTYRILDGDGGSESVIGTGTLDGNRFRASGSARASEDGVTCDLTTTYSGTIANDTATGSTQGSSRCSGQGGAATINFSGNFSLPKTGNAKAPRNGSVFKTLIELVQ